MLIKNITIKPLITYGLLCFIINQPAFAADTASQYSFDRLMVLTITVIALLVLTISSLQRSRLKHKVAENKLKKIRKNLEQRVEERTEKLAAINVKLCDEISRHKTTELLLRQTQDHLHSIVNSMPSIIIGVNPQLLITHWNESAERIVGVTAANALGKDLNEVYPSHIIPHGALQLAIDKGEVQDCKNVQHGEGSHTQYSDITVYPIESNERATGAVIRIDDVTQRIQLENMMVQNEKMMSLGELAAGMAHEINNPLSAVVQGAQNIQRRLSNDLSPNIETAQSLGTSTETINQYMEQREILRFLNNIREAGERAADIVNNMLEFSRYNNRTHYFVDIAVLMDHCLTLANSAFHLESSTFDAIEIVKHYPSPAIPQISCSGVEIQQVILNILRNAAQALGKDDQIKHNKTPRIEILLKLEDNNVVIEIADNGIGMTEPVRRHIFEPFYTTKDVGQGTGLGLSVSYFIITKHHHGTIDVVSTPSEGTRFIIKIPARFGES